MLKLNPQTLEITCPSGDTGLLLVRITASDGSPLPQPVDGVAVFAVCQEVKTTRSFSPLVNRPVQIVDNQAAIHITNAFSRTITPGEYRWDIRIVTDPDYDEDGEIICADDTDEVHSLFAGREGGMPKYTVPGVAVNV